MGRLIIDGKNVFEIDEECLKKKQIKNSCDINKYFDKKSTCKNQDKKEKR